MKVNDGVVAECSTRRTQAERTAATRALLISAARKLFADAAERRVRTFPFRFHNYPVTQNNSIHTSIPTLLANLHRVDNLKDAQAYVTALRNAKRIRRDVY